MTTAVSQIRMPTAGGGRTRSPNDNADVPKLEQKNRSFSGLGLDA